MHISSITAHIALLFFSVAPYALADSLAATGVASYAVTTANPYATEAGLKTIADGGSVADAAVAIQMVLGVVEPQSSGLGGGAIAIYYAPERNDLLTFDGLSRSPAGYDPLSEAKPHFSHSGAAVGVPGTLRLLERLHQAMELCPGPNFFYRRYSSQRTASSLRPIWPARLLCPPRTACCRRSGFWTRAGVRFS